MRHPHLDLSRFQFAQPAHYTVIQTFTDYSRERLIAKGKDPLRAWMGFNNFFWIAPPEMDVTKLTTGQVEDFIDMRLGEGCSPLTPRRELTFISAAINNARRRNRIPVAPYIELPSLAWCKETIVLSGKPCWVV